MNVNKSPLPLGIPPLIEIPSPREIPLPNELKVNKLALFIGAGISRLLGLPSWKGLAEDALESLRKRERLNYFEVEQIKSLEPRQILSMAEWLYQKEDFKREIAKRLQELEEEHSKEQNPENIYDTINKIGCVYVTTNYDEFLVPQPLSTTDSTQNPETPKRWDVLDENPDKLLGTQGTIIHLHGHRSKFKKMVVTTEEYLEHYASQNTQDFLKKLFKKKTVVFLGYGLKEVEILEHILRRVRQEDEKSEQPENQEHFLVQGFFCSQKSLYKNLYRYYKKTFGVTLIGFIKDYENHHGIETIIRDWANQIKPPSLYDKIERIRKVSRNG